MSSGLTHGPLYIPTSPANSRLPVADLGRAHAEQAFVTEGADGHFRDVFVTPVDQADMEIARGAEITFVGEIRSFANGDRVNRFRHQPVQVRISLPMGMGAQIDRHVVDPDRHVGAVVEIVAAQKILVGFALSAVLRHDRGREPASRTSPGRVTGRALSCSPVMVIWLAMFGGPAGPEATFGAPAGIVVGCGTPFEVDRTFRKLARYVYGV